MPYDYKPQIKLFATNSVSKLNSMVNDWLDAMNKRDDVEIIRITPTSDSQHFCCTVEYQYKNKED